MKKLLLSFIFLLGLSSLSWAGWDFPNGWDSGAIRPPSIVYPGIVATTNQTLTIGQSGNFIIFNNSTGIAANGTQFTLPTAVVGLMYTVIADTNKWFYLTPQSADTINFSTMTAGQRIANSASAAIGDSISVVCMTAGKWSIVDRIGTWAQLN